MDVYSYSKLYHRGGNISFRNSVAFIAVRSRLFATNTTLRNGPGKEHQGLPIFFSIPSKNMLGILKGYLGYLGYSRPMEDLGLSQHRGQFPNQF